MWKVMAFLSFAKNIGKYVTKNLSAKCSEKPFHSTEKSWGNVLETAWKGTIQKPSELTSDLIGNKITDAIAK